MKQKKHKQVPDAEATATDGPAPEEAEAAAATDESSASEEAQLRAERDQLQDKLTRAMADLANIRKRHANELGEARQRTVEALAHELLPVLDNFHLALAAQESAGEMPAEVKAMFDGLVMVRSLLEGTLERHGLSEIPATGESFDPNLHEAVSIDTESDQPAGTITSVMQRGYRLGERVIRASRVMVAGAPPEESSEPSSDSSDANGSD